MRVLINGLQLGENNSGVQFYTKHLYIAIKELRHTNIVTQLYQSNSCPSLFPLFLSSKKSRLVRIFNENFCLPRYFYKNGFDLFHSPNYVLPLFIKSQSIVVVHDLITFDFPSLCQRESVLYFRLFLPYSIWKADKIITVSKTVKKDILSRFKMSENKVVVIPLGVSNIFKRTVNKEVLLKYSINKKYILFVGNIEPKKNLVRLIKAYYNLICTKNISHKLVIAGKKGWKFEEVFKIVQLLKLQESVIFTGYVPDHDLPVLYSMADLFVFPSIYEGFGIPPLEAMACETPVLASNAGALPETTGGNCLLVDPFSVDEIADGIYQMLTNAGLSDEFVTKGKKWVQQFCWEKVARKTLKIYEEMGKAT